MLHPCLLSGAPKPEGNQDLLFRIPQNRSRREENEADEEENEDGATRAASCPAWVVTVHPPSTPVTPHYKMAKIPGCTQEIKRELVQLARLNPNRPFRILNHLKKRARRSVLGTKKRGQRSC